MYGIPNMKLEKSIVERRVQLMKDEGVEFRMGVNVGKDLTVVWYTLGSLPNTAIASS